MSLDRTTLIARSLPTLLLVSTAGCAGGFNGLVARYGPTTDEAGSVKLQADADAGRALLEKGEYLQAIKNSGVIWPELSTSDSRKGGIASVYFRDFCDALYAAEPKMPAFESASLFQLAVETFPKSTWKDEFIASDREQLTKRSAEAFKRARPELESFAAAAEKRGNVATAAMYVGQISRMFPDDTAAAGARQAAIEKVRAAYTSTLTVKGTASLVKQVTTAGDRPSKVVADGADLQADLNLGVSEYTRTQEPTSLTAKVVRGKKEEKDRRYAELTGLIEGEESHIKSLESSIRSSTNVESNTKARNEHQAKLEQYRAERSKRTATVMVDNVVDVSYPGVRDILGASQPLTGKLAVAGESDREVRTSVSASTDVVSHEGLAEARLAPQHSKLPANGALDAELLTRAAEAARAELTKAYDVRLATRLKPLQAGDKDAQVEALTVALILTGADAEASSAKVLALTRMPDVKALFVAGK